MDGPGGGFVEEAECIAADAGRCGLGDVQAGGWKGEVRLLVRCEGVGVRTYGDCGVLWLLVGG